MGAENPEISSLREALAVSPDNLPLRRLLADSLLRHQCPQDAVEVLKDLLRRSPGDLGALFALAQAYWASGQVTEAGMALENLLRQEPRHAEAHLLHARVLIREGEKARAARRYQEAVSLRPDLVDLALEHAMGADRPRLAPQEAVEEGRLPLEYPDDAAPTEIERPKTRFDDVGGMEGVKDEVRMKIILPLRNPELFQAYGKKAGGGILLYGPPGCGKTHIARATAGEVEAAFIAVGISDVLDMWIGQSERNLHELFSQARRNRPCVLFFDEVDALGANRSDLRKQGGRNLINQFLMELDGIEQNNEGVLILAATNAPWHLDPAFRRPGRFDKIIFVPPPDLEGRETILRLHLRGKPAGEVDFRKVAEKTELYSGADLRGLVDTAVEDKLRAAMKTGRVEPIATRDLTAAASKVRAGTREWFATARNHALYANQNGQYDEILEFTKRHRLG